MPIHIMGNRMLTSLDIQHRKSLNTAEFIRQLSERIQPDEIPPIHQLWRGILLEDYLSNPAYRVSRSLDDGQQSEDGTFRVVIVLPDGSEIGEDDLIKWTVVGRGEIDKAHKKGKPEFSKVYSCEDDMEHPITMPRDHCGKLSCPKCAVYEIAYAATQQAIKLMSGAKYAELNNRADRVLQHLNVSPPEALYYNFLTIAGFKKMKEYAIKVAIDAGIKGGLIIFHPYRQNGRNDDDELPEDYNPTMANDGDKHRARFAPHFHVIGFGWVKPSSDAFTASHKGWIYKALRTGDNRLRTITDVIGVINYVMSHAGIFADDSPAKINRFMTITTIGLCNSANLRNIGEIRVYVQELCKVCGGSIVAHAVRRGGEDIELKGHLYKMQKFPIYADAEHAERMNELFEEYMGTPIELLQIIERNPQLGVCYMTSRQLDRKLTAPTAIYAEIDNSLHIPDVYATAHIPEHVRKKRAQRHAKKIDPEQTPDEPVILRYDLDPEETPPDEPIPAMDYGVFRLMT